MFSLLYGLYQYLFSKPEYNVLIIGLDSAGKTVLPKTITCSLL
jgi:ADP-ribosylation factor related protein 1